MNLFERILEAKKRKIKVSPVHANRASEIGKCERYLCYCRLNWQDRQPHSPEVELIFEEGRRQELAVIQDLREAGFKIEEMQQSLSWSQLNLYGHIDGKILIDDKWLPFEIKSASPYVYPSFRDAESIRNHRYYYARAYFSQIQAYLLLTNEPQYLLIFKNRSSGEIKEILIDLDYEFAEELLKKVERINAHVESKTYPDVTECPDNRCPFLHICLPGRDFGPGTGIVIDAELEAMLERRAETKISRNEYEELDEEIKAKFQGHEGVIECGRFEIKTTWTPEKVYTEAMVPKPRAAFWKIIISEKKNE